MGCARRVPSIQQSTAVCSAQAQLPERTSDTCWYKEALLDSFRGTERGLKAAPETRAEINEAISQLEAMNPHSSPISLEVFGGRWRLVYTSNSELGQVLALTHLPFVQAVELHQNIEWDTSTVENAVDFVLPGCSVSVHSIARFKVESPKRIGLHFDQTTPGPANVRVTVHVANLDTNATVKALRNALTPVIDTSTAVVDFVTGFMGALGHQEQGANQQRATDMPVLSPLADTWLITSYLDTDLCIRRGDAGSVFVFARECTQLQLWEAGDAHA